MRNMNGEAVQDISVMLFISDLNALLEKETFNYCYYDFKREKIKDVNIMYNILVNSKNDDNYMKNFCNNVSKELLKYDITSICNIIYGKTYKYAGRTDIPIQINNGYYYSFTAVCKKKRDI